MTVTVGGRDITNLVIGQLSISQTVESGSIRTRAEARIRNELDVLKMLDWRQPVVVRIEDGPQSQANLFSGFALRVETDGGNLSVALSDPSVLLDEEIMGGGFGAGISIPETLYYLLATAMPESADPKLIQTGPGTSLADQRELFHPRMFSFLAPLPFIEPPQEPQQFLDGLIYAGHADASYDERIILGAKFKEPVEEFAEGKARIRFVFHASDFLDAFEKGQFRLRRALDLMALAADSSGVVLSESSGEQLLTFDRARLDHEIREPNWLFVRDNLPGRPNRHWLRWYAPNLRQSNLNLADPHFLIFEQFLNEIATRDSAALTARERALLSAVHALRRSRQAIHLADALSLLWQAVEYLVAGFPAEPPISPSTAKSLVQACLTEIKQLEPHLVDEQLAYVEKHIRRGMNLVRSLPLKDKWNAVCAEFGLFFNEEEEGLLDALRRARNYEMHGSEAPIKRKDVQKALAMVEKVTLVGISRAKQDRQLVADVL